MDNLTMFVEAQAENMLMVIPARNYEITRPLKTKPGQAILPDAENGFINLTPSNQYNIEGEIFSVFQMGEGSRQGGIKIDSDNFKDLTAFTEAKKRSLVYSTNIRKFSATRFDLMGSQGLDAVFWADNDDFDISSPKDIKQILTHSYT